MRSMLFQFCMPAPGTDRRASGITVAAPTLLQPDGEQVRAVWQQSPAVSIFVASIVGKQHRARASSVLK